MFRKNGEPSPSCSTYAKAMQHLSDMSSLTIMGGQHFAVWGKQQNKHRNLKYSDKNNLKQLKQYS